MKNTRNRFMMLVLFTIYCLVFMVLVTFSSAITRHAMAETYKWVDDQGVTHYTQTPPPAGNDFATIKPPPPVDDGVVSKRLDKQQQYIENRVEMRQKEAEAEKLAAMEKAQRQKNCQLARDRLASYQRPRVQFLQDDGSRVRATEEQRQAELRKSQDMIQEFCD